MTARCRMYAAIGLVLSLAAGAGAQPPTAGSQKLSEEVLTLLEGIQRRSESLANVDMTLSYEGLLGPDQLARMKQDWAEAGHKDHADELRAYHRSVLRVACYGEKYRVEVRDVVRSGQVRWYLEEPTPDWQIQPLPHQVYVVETFNGRSYAHYVAPENRVYFSSNEKPIKLRLAGPGWRANVLQVVEQETLRKLLEGECTEVVSRRGEDGIIQVQAVLTYKPAGPDANQPLCQAMLWVDPDLGYPLVKYASRMLWGKERRPGSGEVVLPAEPQHVAEGLYAPFRVDRHEYRYDQEGRPQWWGSTRYRLTGLSLLTRDYPSLFEFLPPVGVQVFDLDTKTQRVVGGTPDPPFAGADGPLEPPDLQALLGAETPG